MNGELFLTSSRATRNISGTGAKYLLAFSLVILVLGQNVIVRAQDPLQGVGPAPSTSSQPAATNGPPTTSISDVYLISPDDVLEIDVYDVPELSHTYTVNTTGAISMPLLPTPIKAAGLTPDQFARALEEAYRQSGRLLRPEIAVSVKQSPASSVAVEGGVRNPQILLEIGRVKLADVITQCGGLAEDAGPMVTITRSPVAIRALASEGGVATPTLTVNLTKVMDVTDPLSSTAVWPGDRVNIEREPPDVYYVLGEVKTPGGYTLKKSREELTVLRALALAGDVTGVAKKSRAFIIRKDPNAPKKREEIKLDLQNILMGKSPDPVLQADDILFVPGSNGKKALHTLQNAPAMIVGEAGAAAILAH